MIADNSLLLVGVVPNPKDMEIARVLGWYRIPFKMAPKIVDVDYLAFYQTSTFGDQHKWRIESFAEVKGYELTTRVELIRDEPDHPRAHEEYYKLELGPVQKRNEPILAEKWKRVTFLYTIGELFNRAHWLNDLVVNSDERALLWQSLREHAQVHAEYHHKKDEPEIEIDPSLMMFLENLEKDSNNDFDFFSF